MRRGILTALVGVAAFSTSALAQATLETLMTHSLSTSAGTHAGTALGRATNGVADRLAHQVSTVAPRTSTMPRQTTSAPRHVGMATKAGVRRKSVLPSTTESSAQPSGNGSLIASIQGGEPHTRNCTPAIATTVDAQTPPQANTTCTPDASPAADAHPSVVNLPAAQ